MVKSEAIRQYNMQGQISEGKFQSSVCEVLLLIAHILLTTEV